MCGELHSIWNLASLLIKVRVFAFQFYNNSLATAPRLAGRYLLNPAVQVDERCCFCIKARVMVPAREDFDHIFSAAQLWKPA